MFRIHPWFPSNNSSSNQQGRYPLLWLRLKWPKTKLNRRLLKQKKNKILTLNGGLSKALAEFSISFQSLISSVRHSTFSCMGTSSTCGRLTFLSSWRWSSLWLLWCRVSSTCGAFLEFSRKIKSVSPDGSGQIWSKSFWQFSILVSWMWLYLAG